jgi:hypothetical protein
MKMRLRWTNRLKDYLAKHRFFIEISGDLLAFCNVREVELVHDQAEPNQASAVQAAESAKSPSVPSSRRKRKASAKSRKRVSKAPAEETTESEAERDLSEETVVFEAPPAFDQFVQCYDGSSKRFHVNTTSRNDRFFVKVSGLGKPEFPVPDTSFDAMSREGGKFCVLWLTETVFITSVAWGTMSYDYEIVLTPCFSNEKIVFYAYKVSLLLGSHRPAPSFLPVSFLASITSQLRYDCFKTVRFHWHRNEFPLPVQLLSIIPPRTGERSKGSIDFKTLTQVEFGNILQPQDTLAMLSHCEQLGLSVRHCYNFELDTAFNAALRECPNLHHIHVPQNWVQRRLEEGEIPFTENRHIESITLDVWRLTLRSPLLKGAAANHRLKHISVKACDGLSCLEAFFSGASLLQEMIILSTVSRGEESVNSVSQILDAYAVSAARNLSHFSLVMCNSNEEPDWRAPVFQNAMTNIDLWDKHHFPRLAVNWYRKYVEQHRERRLVASIPSMDKEPTTEHKQLAVIPWNVRAVNLGVVYRKTTYHIPYDMCTTNASVLFVMLRADIV